MYLSSLQVREKWANAKGPFISTGTMVLIREENLPPLKWKIGRVVEFHVDQDGTIRVATVRTVDGVFNRAVRLLGPLPFEGNC